MNNYAFIIGVGQRSDDSPAMAITAKDATRLARELDKRDIVPYENISLLIDGNATKNNIIEEINALVEKTQTNEANIVWVYFSGHGCKKITALDTTYYLITNDSLACNLEKTALLGTDFIKSINKIKSKKILLLLDCCHAGGVKLGKCNLPFKEKDFLTNSNRVIISSSHADQISFASEPLSVFTYVLVNGLAGAYFEENDKEVTVFDLAMYLRETVYPLTKRQQRPQLDVFKNTETENFVLCTYSNDRPIVPAFDSAFKLTDGSGKQLDLTQKETDIPYREQFKWFSSIKGNKNIVNQGIENSKINITFK